MSKHPELLRRPLPPKDALPLSPPKPSHRPPDKISTKKALVPHGEYKKEHDSSNQPEIMDGTMTYRSNGLPSRSIIVHRQDDPIFAENNFRYYIPVEFRLDDFLLKPRVFPLPSNDKKVVLSSYNYKKIVKLLASELWNHDQEKVNIIELPIDDIPAVSRRIPQRQRILEIIAAARNQESEFRTAASPELAGAVLNIEGRTQFLEYPETESPIMKEEPEGKVNPYALLILRTLAMGGDSLNLRGHFIHQLPDLSGLFSILKHVNLSFNSFQDIPAEIYGCSHLETLNLRDNPITEISSDITKLTNLRIFNISFCMVSILPPGLYLLPHLQSLNVAYNKISFISKDIRNLSALQFLNVEGNELMSLPCDLLQLQLKNLLVENNYMHPLFWKEYSLNQPQQLTDLAAITFSKNHLSQHYTNIPKEVQNILNNATTCDCCQGPLYGPGFHLIQPHKMIFNTESLPFLYHACSPSCYKWFMSKTH